MASQRSLDKAYMKCAFTIAEMSHATRRKVGAILVSQYNDLGIIAEGFNGTPAGFNNICEVPVPDMEYAVNALAQDPFDTPKHKTKFKTKPEVLHAESNAIAKMARSTQSSFGATMYCTDTPCFNCAKLIIQAGVARLVYARHYEGSLQTGLDLLREARITIDRLDLSSHNSDDGLDQQDEGCYDHGTEDCYRS